MWGWSGWDRSGEELTRELLATLEGVSEEDKAPLLEMLGELNRCAGGQADPDPRTPLAGPAF